ncbi:MAG TPA: hypothetical protein EYO37_10990 [Nitrospina sp.]|nr:hypothetical protein [Nitrospina sp.]
MKIEVSNGEILDKLSILELKLHFMEDEVQKANVQKEHDLLKKASAKILLTSNKTFPKDVYNELCNVNLKLWSIEHKIREKELNDEFDKNFIKLARSVYKTNDKRARIKKEINVFTGSTLVEEKHYED